MVVVMLVIVLKVCSFLLGSLMLNFFFNDMIKLIVFREFKLSLVWSLVLGLMVRFLFGMIFFRWV